MSIATATARHGNNVFTCTQHNMCIHVHTLYQCINTYMYHGDGMHKALYIYYVRFGKFCLSKPLFLKFLCQLIFVSWAHWQKLSDNENYTTCKVGLKMYSTLVSALQFDASAICCALHTYACIIYNFRNYDQTECITTIKLLAPSISR